MEKQKISVRRTLGKIGKRNVIIIASVLLIGLAVYLNFRWFYNPTGVKYDGGGITGDDANASGTPTSTSDYFSSTSLSRKTSRDEAIEVLQSVVSSETATGETKDRALESISQIALDMQNESAIETLVKAKGFDECVAVVGDGKASVVVKTDGLLASQVAQINEIVYEQTGILPVNVKIIEKTGT